MEIAVIGINHNTAPIEIRERVSFTESMKIESANRILDKSTEEIIIISTCNRSEIYISTNDIDKAVEEIKEFYREFFEFDEVKDYIFTKKGRDVVVHLYMVASGLDSIILGEDQILGQIRKAMMFSMNLGFSKKVLSRLFMDAICEGKKIRNSIKISEIPLSTSYIGINLLKEKMGGLRGKKALVIGAGEISTLAIRYLYEEELEKIYVTNRTHGKIKELFKEFDGLNPVEYNNRYDVLREVDILITATGAPHTIISYNNVVDLNNQLYILDLGLPRDVDSQIGEKENIVLYHNDDLKKVSEENLLKRKRLSDEAMEIINEDVDKYMKWIRNISVDPVLESLNKRCSSIKSETMDYINRKIDLDKREEKIIDKMIMSALKKVIREPIKALKKLDEENIEEYIEVIEKLFEI
ncbi:glutamyl-tRNA reductase [Tissierella sp. MSJ-40]|uniref:Glutamyl-tRNA reductase n=1 Tax=Tissierella simiarum TaxID=2841534 RepID=A0ABS6E5T4_9FIRM|nr:glutamyl-tRNA reductase [Tissierella simiarum]MBU5437901.1 glutamyl-tRNA reductase [Tissierella simiarum]